jgi:hypothetical protein
MEQTGKWNRPENGTDQKPVGFSPYANPSGYRPAEVKFVFQGKQVVLSSSLSQAPILTKTATASVVSRTRIGNLMPVFELVCLINTTCQRMTEQG